MIAGRGKPAYLWDDGLPGFGVKALPSGKKRYLVKYRTSGGGRLARQRWFTLGTHGQLTADQARKLAQQVLAAAARGQDPQEERMTAQYGRTFRDLWAVFEREHLPALKPATQRDYKLGWKQAIDPMLGRLETREIKRSDAERLHKRLRDTPYRANRILALLSRLMTLAEILELRPQGTNPCRYVERFPECARNRFLNDEELARLGQALRDMEKAGALPTSAANAVRLLLLTGARLNEVLLARWEWFDPTRRIIALPDSKTGAKPLFLSQAALEVVGAQQDVARQSPLIFPSPDDSRRSVHLRGPWERICTQADLVNVRLHDLRHTAASVAVGAGISLPVIGRLLGHTQSQTTQRYAHVGNDPALSAANVIADVIAEKIWRA